MFYLIRLRRVFPLLLSSIVVFRLLLSASYFAVP